MIGCLRRVGCLAVFLVVIVVAWVTRDWWLSRLPFRAKSAAPAVASWESPTPEGAGRAEAAIRGLQGPSGPVFVNIAAGDLLAYIAQALRRALPESADSVQAAVIGERLYVRARIRTADLGGKAALGPLASLLGEWERVQLGGVLRVVRPGLSEFQVKEVAIRDWALPQAIIPGLIRHLARGDRPPELARDGIPLATPEYIGDARVSNGRVTLYRTVSPK